MINVVILEDEMPSRNKLKRYLEQLGEPLRLVKELDSVESAITFFSQNPKVDLLISDIELLDGNVFQLFEEVAIPCPIIFTTAYNQFWMQAFEGNGIEYLLKPFNFGRFQKAWEKYRRLSKTSDFEAELMARLQDLLKLQKTEEAAFRKRISVPTPRGSYFLDLDEVSCLVAENAVVWAIDQQGKRHLLQEATLKELEAALDPTLYFRISRSHLIQKKFVVGTERYSKNSVAVKMKGIEQLLVCSQSATPEFLRWVAV
jgi:DNA-binding LytR/AlgR family response regulator